MGEAILAINAGTSSVGVTIFNRENPPRKIATAKVAGITAPPRVFKYAHGDTKQSKEIEEQIDTPQNAFKYLLTHFLNDSELEIAGKKDDIAYICHRVVHGGDFKHEAVITTDTFGYLEALQDLAPLHNTASLDIIRTCLNEIPNAKSVAYFDTTFHQSLPDYIKTYPVRQDVARSNWLRKYGFHGISYKFIARSVAEFLKKPLDSTNIIALHLGSGASLCAIRAGKPIDTSMGLTPLAGLPGATRSGDIDPTLVFHYTSEASKLSSSSTKDMRLTQAEEILNKQAGWKALTGSTDFSKIATESPETDMHRLAFDIFVDRIVGFIGSYFVKLDGVVDAVVFAGGIGEKSAILRKAIAEKCRCLGFLINQQANSKDIADDAHTVTDMSAKSGQKPAVLVCQTDEEVSDPRFRFSIVLLC
ncbi:acetate kinase [Uncinocarpus reesii 1704]|uniref:Probable acetate kinase n=1 Tax=Uncinocarpus reesii (strain UAMH 1704) TaxID=336963 RepID=C4JZC3_UNCRE|nr:acetate kinase [Uncinocarpus reesii 1704]EEP82659.1 acetate kinase [Uncinocarpus reesii 1704]